MQPLTEQSRPAGYGSLVEECAPALLRLALMLTGHLSHRRATRRRIQTVRPPESWQGPAVLVLRFYEDLPDSEIADLLSCSESTVRSNASRGLASLRARLQDRPQS